MIMRSLVFTVAAAAVAAACSDNSGPDMALFSASVTVAPAPSATNVSRGDTVRMWLDMPMDSASCGMRFTLHLGDSTGVAVPGRMMFGDGYRQMMFVPDSLMRAGTRYFGHMRDSVMMRETMHGDGMGGQMNGGRMMTMGGIPAGASRMRDGMGWSFTTGN
jgi:hypothetical protein